MLFDSYFTFESKLGWHRSFLTVESTRGIRALVVVFELLEELVAWGCKNGKFNEQFQILPLELKIKFIWIAFVCISDGLRSTCLIYICYASCWEHLTFSKIYLEFDRFSRVWLKRTDTVSLKSFCFLDWNMMFTKVASIDEIEFIYMAGLFVFCWVP